MKKLPNGRLPEVSSRRRIGEVIEELATEIQDELLQETFIDLNPDVRRLGNINEEDSDYVRKRRAEEG